MMLLATLACEISFSTASASIDNERLATDQDGNNRTTTFAPTDTIYVVFDLKDAPNDTTVQTVWYALDDSGETELYRSETLETSTARIYFNLSNATLPEGRYKVDILLNGERERSLEFTVVAP